MNRYTIYCTEEQTRKALELGAPIHSIRNAFTSKDIPHFKVGNKKDWVLYLIPTAEQMIGWLEEKFLNEIHIEQDSNNDWGYIIYNGCNVDVTDSFDLMQDRKEATIAAIDAALEYLSGHK